MDFFGIQRKIFKRKLYMTNYVIRNVILVRRYTGLGNINQLQNLSIQKAKLNFKRPKGWKREQEAEEK